MTALASGEGPRRKRRSDTCVTEPVMRTPNKFLENCVAKERFPDEERWETWCGVGTPFEPRFFTAEHAQQQVASSELPIPCPYCMTEIEKHVLGRR